jgi:DNA polymerase-3 subunit delta'
MATATTNDNPRLVGHEWAASLLQSSIDAGKVGHAYIFNGPASVGKTRLAHDFTMALNCEQPPQGVSGLRFCGVCRACRLIAADKHSDVTVISLEWQGRQPENQGSANNNLKIDTIRSIQAEINRPPKEVPWRVYIVQDVNTMQPAAANAFLKTLEEPPSRAILILLSDSDRALLSTIVSRCQVIELRPVPTATIETALKERGVAESQAKTLAALAAGRPGYALRSLQDRTQKDRNDRDEALMQLAELLPGDRVKRMVFAEELTKKWQDGGEKRASIVTMLNIWLGWWRDLALIKNGLSTYITNLDRQDELKKQVTKFTPLQIKEMITGITHASAELESNVSPRLALGDLFINKLPRV